MMIRGLMVYNYLMETLEKVGKKSKEDVRNNKDWRWRFEEFNKVSFYEMALKFWRPLSSFYNEDRLLK